MVKYNKLWKMLIDKNLKKKDLYLSGVSPATVTKMGHGGYVSGEVLEKLCLFLECGVDDILEFVPDEEKR